MAEGGHSTTSPGAPSAECPDSQGSVAGSAAPFVSTAPAQSKSGKKSVGGAAYDPPLPFLQGLWRGRGKGSFPTIRPFEWHEELSIQGNTSNPRPVLHYRQKTWSKHTNPKPMHEEQGWIRVLPMTDEETGCQRVEVIGAAQNGTSTIEEGYVRDNRVIVLRSTGMARSSTSRNPYALEFTRVIEVDTSCDPPTLHYTMDMSTSAVPELTRHLEAWLVKLHDAGFSPTPTVLYASPSGAASPVGTAAAALRTESSTFHPPFATLSSSPASSGSHFSHLHPGLHGAAHVHAAPCAHGQPPRPGSILMLSSNSGSALLHNIPGPSSNGAVLGPTPPASAALLLAHHHPVLLAPTSTPSPPPLVTPVAVPYAAQHEICGTAAAAMVSPVHMAALLDRALHGLVLSNSAPLANGSVAAGADAARAAGHTAAPHDGHLPLPGLQNGSGAGGAESHVLTHVSQQGDDEAASAVRTCPAFSP